MVTLALRICMAGIRPDRAASCLSGPGVRSAGLVVLAFAIFSGLTAGIAVWACAVIRMVPPPTASFRPLLDREALIATWAAMHSGRGPGPVESTAVVVATCFVLFYPGIALLVLHRATRWPRFRTACRAALIAAAAASLPAFVGTCGFAGLTVWCEAALVREAWDLADVIELMRSGLLMPCVFLAALAAAGRFADALADCEPEPAGRPLCEACGYDRTGIELGRRCPECGAAADAGCRRGPTPWDETCPSPRRWLATLLRIILTPRAFYAAMATRVRPDRLRRHAALNITLLSLACPTFIGLALWQQNAITPVDLELVLLLWAAAAWTAVVAVLVHRGLAAVCVITWLATAALRDLRAATRIVGHEAAFLWLPAAWGYGLAGSVLLADRWWISDLLNISGPAYKGAAEVASFCLGVILLCALWLYRYRIAWRLVRWARA